MFVTFWKTKILVLTNLTNSQDFHNSFYINCEDRSARFSKSKSASSVPNCTDNSVGRWGDLLCSHGRVSLPPARRNELVATLLEAVEFEISEAPINVSVVHAHILFNEVEIKSETRTRFDNEGGSSTSWSSP